MTGRMVRDLPVMISRAGTLGGRTAIAVTFNTGTKIVNPQQLAPSHCPLLPDPNLSSLTPLISRFSHLTSRHRIVPTVG